MFCDRYGAGRRNDRFAACLVVVSLSCLGATACKKPEPEVARRPSEIVDVEPVIEDVHTTGDAQAVARRPTLVGVMPSSFPADLPLLLPASLVDFGTTEGGQRSVSLATSARSSKVRPELLSLLSQHGWSSEDIGGGRALLRKDSRTVQLRVESESSGTIYHFEY